jgi:Flp pilus assembly pilin Flp
MLNLVRDRMLLSQIILLNALVDGRDRLRDALARPIRDERGQTPTEYLMIVGLMAAVILIAFVTLFWDRIKVGAAEWANKVNEAIIGTNIKQ